MGGAASGTPPSREQLENAFALIEGGLSIRETAKRCNIDRTTISKYLADPMFRRKVRRCGECGAVVDMPCLLCSTDLKVAAMHAAKRRLAKARRKSV